VSVPVSEATLHAPNRPERGYIQAVAWFQLAGDQGITEAKELSLTEVAKFTPAQTNWLTTLKAKLVQK
jgi:hypothetical protein